MTERTLALIKPDGVERRLIGEIISRIERKGLTVAALELKNVSDELARAHYAEHDGKPFFGSLLEFITGGPVVALVLEGPRAIAAFRQLAGGTDPVEKAAPGSIRGDLGRYLPAEIVDKVVKREQDMQLGGSRRDISVLFADSSLTTSAGVGVFSVTLRNAGARTGLARKPQPRSAAWRRSVASRSAVTRITAGLWPQRWHSSAYTSGPW